MRVFAPTIRSLHVLALITFSTARRPYFYRVVSVSVDQNGITHTHARLTFNPLVTPIGTCSPARSLAHP